MLTAFVLPLFRYVCFTCLGHVFSRLCSFGGHVFCPFLSTFVYVFLEASTGTYSVSTFFLHVLLHFCYIFFGGAGTFFSRFQLAFFLRFRSQEAS